MEEAKIGELKLAVHMGRVAVARQQRRVAALVEDGASEESILLARHKLTTLAIFHAEDEAELKRQTTN